MKKFYNKKLEWWVIEDKIELLEWEIKELKNRDWDLNEKLKNGIQSNNYLWFEQIAKEKAQINKK